MNEQGNRGAQGAFFIGVYLDDVIDARTYLLRALWQSANFIQSLLLIVLCNMLDYLSDFDDVDDDFEYDGRSYRF